MKGTIELTTGTSVHMRCGYPHMSSDKFFIPGDWGTTVSEVAQKKGWHLSRKYGWLCPLKHQWRVK